MTNLRGGRLVKLSRSVWCTDLLRHLTIVAGGVVRGEALVPGVTCRGGVKCKGVNAQESATP